MVRVMLRTGVFQRPTVFRHFAIEAAPRPRGETPRAWAVCRFVDPIADIAVLCSPNAPHADDYKALMATATALSIADRVRHPVNFWATARLGRWSPCSIRGQCVPDKQMDASSMPRV
jgi:hypothetical protein